MFLPRTQLTSLCRSRGTSFFTPSPGAINQLLPVECRDSFAIQRQEIHSLPPRLNTPHKPLNPPTFSSSRGLSPSLLILGSGIQVQSRRGFRLNETSFKGVNPPVMDMRNTDIDINPDEIEFVGRKLRKFQMDTTGACDPLPSEVEPSPLHLVTLIRPYSGNVWWLKKILWEFGMYRNRTNQKVSRVPESHRPQYARKQSETR